LTPEYDKGILRGHNLEVVIQVYKPQYDLKICEAQKKLIEPNDQPHQLTSLIEQVKEKVKKRMKKSFEDKIKEFEGKAKAHKEQVQIHEQKYNDVLSRLKLLEG